jgi:hypothetical protein
VTVARRTLATHDQDARWDELQHALASLVEVLDSDQFLIIQVSQLDTDDDPAPYVQLAVHDTGIYAETVSNHHLRAIDRLDRPQKRTLIELGWNAPPRAPRGPDGDTTAGGSTNYSREYDEPIEAATVAADLVTVLRQVHEVTSPHDLEYRAFAERPSAIILVPTLRIRHSIPAEPEPTTALTPAAPDDVIPVEARPAVTAGYL